jgi:uncharacterized MAPEG superfamily protein
VAFSSGIEPNSYQSKTTRRDSPTVLKRAEGHEHPRAGSARVRGLDTADALQQYWSLSLATYSDRARLDCRMRADVPQGNEWYQRAMRAHMNCVENLPIYTAVVVALVATHMQSATIDRLAVALMIARVAQTFTHIALPPNECRHQPSIWVLLHSGSVHDRNGCHDSCGHPFMMREQSRGNSSLLLPLLAQSGHPDTLTQCPLSGVKRTSRGHASMSASDPKRTSPSSSIPA